MTDTQRTPTPDEWEQWRIALAQYRYDNDEQLCKTWERGEHRTNAAKKTALAAKLRDPEARRKWLFGKALAMRVNGADYPAIVAELCALDHYYFDREHSPPVTYDDNGEPADRPLETIAADAGKYMPEARDPLWFGLSHVEALAQMFLDMDQYGALMLTNKVIDTRRLGSLTYPMVARVALAIHKAVITAEGYASHDFISPVANVKDSRLIRAAVDLLDYYRYAQADEEPVYLGPRHPQNRCTRYELGPAASPEAWQRYCAVEPQVIRLRPPEHLRFDMADISTSTTGTAS